MAIFNQLHDIIAGENPHKDTVTDVKAYTEALEKSGYTHEEAKRYWSDPSNADPIAKYQKELNIAANTQVPRVIVDNGKVTINAPESLWESPIVGQLKEELQQLKGVDLTNPNVTNAINALNDELRNNWKNSMVEQTLGWTPEEYKDYQYAIQAVSGTNPLKSTAKLKWAKDGNVIVDSNNKPVYKTPAEWLEYWQQNYNADERTQLFKKSLQSSNPYERTMALVMAQGQENPVYGYSEWERLGQGLGAMGNQLKKFPEGVVRLFGTDNNTKQIEALSKQLNIPVGSLVKATITNEEQFNQRKEELKNKSWSELTDDEKAFITILGVSKDSSGLNNAQRDVRASIPGRGGNIQKDIQDMSAENESTSKYAINDILSDSSFDDYKKAHDSYVTWQNYDEDRSQLEKQLAENAIWSSGEQTMGNIAGTVGRFLWENAVAQGLTGGISAKSLANPKLVKGTPRGFYGNGISLNQMSDYLGEKIVNSLKKFNISPASSFGQGAMNFAANLVGTIPEDIIQTSLDNVLTYNADENKNLLNWENMSENFKWNFITMAAFNAIRVGKNTVDNIRMANQLKKIKDLDAKIHIDGIMADADDAVRAIKNGGTVKVEGDKVSAVNPDGTEIELKNITPEAGEMIIKNYGSGGELDDLDTSPRLQLDEEAKAKIKAESAKAEVEEPRKILIEADSPNGKVMAEVTDYNFRTPTEILKTNLDPTPAGLKYGISKGVDAAMKPFDSYLAEFRNKFPGVQESDFDWVFHKSKQGFTPEQIIGTTDTQTGRTMTKEMIDAMKWWGDQPFNKDFRLASRKALGLDGDKNVLGYLTHTEYDPTNLSYDEALNGVLWKESTGASMMTDGNYTGYGGTFKDRYRTFVKNMLWDAKVNDVTTAKLIEEAELDGRPVTPELIEEAKKVDKGGREIVSKVNESENTKQLANALSSDSEDIDWKGLDEERQKQAQNSGLGQATHDVYSPIYMGSNSKGVKKQPKALGNTFDSLGNNMRNIQLEGGATMYDWGGADIVYAHGNAIELVNRYTSDGGNFRQMLTEFVENHSHRSPEYAESVADRWMKRIGSIPGEMTKGKVIAELANCMKSEGMSRLRKFLTMAKYDEFNASTKKTIDEFLFNHMQMESIKRNPTIGKKITKALEVATSYRYRALFYGNFKNALLQISELSRLFTTFKWGDVAKMAKRLATDEAFRAKVDVYVDAVAPQTNRLNAELYGKYAKAAENLEVKEKGVTFKNLQETIDDVALAPINAAETYKNRMMVAALVQEAESLGLSGNEALSHIRRRFERVALAMNEMGRIGLSSNPLARTMLFLQNFQIRELGMHYYNFLDEAEMGKTIPKKLFNQFKYLSKVFGTKLATTLVLSRIGYSATQTLGIDPFGLMDTYNKMDEDEMTDLDRMISNGVLTPFVSGGMTSLLADLYFMARNAYEDSVRTTVSEEAEQELNKPGFWEQFGRFKLPDDMLSFDNVMGAASNFVPGSTFAKRFNQMNQMMDSGWATSASGNKMYTAPDDIINTILGYLFGRSATANAQQYQQTYGDNLWQTLGRMVPGRSWGDFDPIDDKYYTDWFKGNENDKQQFTKGIYWFKEQRNNILNSYNKAVSEAYDVDQISEAKNNMELRLEELWEKLGRFVDAYENKNGIIDANMQSQILSTLNTFKPTATEGETADELKERKQEGYDRAKERYSQFGFSPVGTYSGPTLSNPTAEVKYWGSPQYQTAVSGYYDARTEAVDVLKQVDNNLAPIRKQLKESLNAAYDRADYDEVERIQYQYLDAFDKAVSPVIAAYGNGILASTDVVNQLKDMLSTGTTSRSGDLIPTEQYKKDKTGRFRTMPYETVDVKKWAQQRFSGDIYKNPTITSNSTAGEDLVEIKKLIRRGQNDRARAKALQLKVRVDNQTRSLSSDDYKWLVSYLNYKEGK